MKCPILPYMMAVFCIVMIALLILPAAVGAAPDDVAENEKPVVAKVPATPTIPEGAGTIEPEGIFPLTASKEKNVTESEPDLVTRGMAPAANTTATPEPAAVENASTDNGEAEPTPPGYSVTGDLPAANTTATEPAAVENASTDNAEAEPTPPGGSMTGDLPSANTTATEPAAVENASTDNGEAEPTPPGGSMTGDLPAANTTATPEPAAVENASTDDNGAEAVPTLEKDAPPRPGATMAKSHKSHHRPLVLSTHPVASPGATYIQGENQPTPAPADLTPHDGLIVSGVGVLLARTPGDVTLTRDGIETANLDWLLDLAMRLGGRHPRVALEGDTFTITVTVEARNVTIKGDDPGFVALVPPPCETGVYEITRIAEPQELRDGERAVWEFSVFTRTGRLTLENLTLIEERRVTNLTATPEIFSFRAFAFTGDQEHPSVGFSDPVIAIRPAGAGSDASSLPALYTLACIQNSTLLPSETIPDAWKRSIGHDQIITGAAGHLDTLKGLGRSDLAAIYAEEGMTRDVPAAASSPFDAILEFFHNLIRLLTGGD